MAMRRRAHSRFMSSIGCNSLITREKHQLMKDWQDQRSGCRRNAYHLRCPMQSATSRTRVSGFCFQNKEGEAFSDFNRLAKNASQPCSNPALNFSLFSEHAQNWESRNFRFRNRLAQSVGGNAKSVNISLLAGVSKLLSFLASGFLCS